MIRGLVVGCVALAACGGGPRVGARTAPISATTTSFADNPLLAFAAADTAYAFATFQPLSLDAIHDLVVASRATARRMPDVEGEAELHQIWVALTEEVGAFDAAHLQTIGVDATARLAIYALGKYPVLRIEIASSERLLQYVQRVAARLAEPLPPPKLRAGYRYWTPGKASSGVVPVIALGTRDVAIGFLPRATFDSALGELLGERRPAKSLTGADFAALGKRDQFPDAGLGFVDVARVVALALDDATLPPGCRPAIEALAHRVPRIAFGYARLSQTRSSMGLVVELAPELVAAGRTLATKLPGFKRIAREPAPFAFAAAFDLTKLAELGLRVASAASEIGAHCANSEIVDSARALATTISAPIPPVIAGFRGMIGAVDLVERGPDGVTNIRGHGAVFGVATNELVRLTGGGIPGLDPLSLTGKAHELPARIIPYPGSFAATGDAIAIALGPDSKELVETDLAGAAVAAPLAFLEYDMRRVARLAFEPEIQHRIEQAHELLELAGLVRFEASVEERGLVVQLSFGGR